MRKGTERERESKGGRQWEKIEKIGLAKIRSSDIKTNAFFDTVMSILKD